MEVPALLVVAPPLVAAVEDLWVLVHSLLVELLNYGQSAAPVLSALRHLVILHLFDLCSFKLSILC